MQLPYRTAQTAYGCKSDAKSTEHAEIKPVPCSKPYTLTGFRPDQVRRGFAYLLPPWPASSNENDPLPNSNKDFQRHSSKSASVTTLHSSSALTSHVNYTRQTREQKRVIESQIDKLIVMSQGSAFREISRQERLQWRRAMLLQWYGMIAAGVGGCYSMCVGVRACVQRLL